MITNLESSSAAVKIISTQSRRADLTPVLLEGMHRKLGQLLSYEFVNTLDLEQVEINHVQGRKRGISVSSKEFTLILVMMRSGLYVAEGFREILDSHSRLEFISNKDDVLKICSKYNLSMTNIVIVDSVINTGKSISNVLEELPSYKSLTVVCQVMYSGFAESDLVQNSNVNFITCRISDNFYVGHGKTDTGNRLFGHIPDQVSNS
ncbi:uracil phosphoribosyltransferase [Methanolobus sediminis]|uniref:Uracil phosphoribosyltransferase n=1 Tax=Methanolobus sediminis TaxID=3072978 RepID=A0AA51ULA8_9EURY|nr:uracil phosphoribosyltransferase [Methanolobus sediminis]WMW25673.1 uracil phosphoribosyltransferase [Methanolobus sediminis]